jgi:hypothetical protein
LSKCVAFQAMVESSSCKRLSSCTSEWKPTGDALYWTVIVARVPPVTPCPIILAELALRRRTSYLPRQGLPGANANAHEDRDWRCR